MRNCSLLAIFPFPTVFSRVLQTRKNQELFRKGLEEPMTFRSVSVRTFVYVQNFFSRPPIPGDHRRSLAFTQRSSGDIPATMGDYQRLLKRQKTLTRTLTCTETYKPKVKIQKLYFRGKYNSISDRCRYKIRLQGTCSLILNYTVRKWH